MCCLYIKLSVKTLMFEDSDTRDTGESKTYRKFRLVLNRIEWLE